MRLLKRSVSVLHCLHCIHLEADQSAIIDTAESILQIVNVIIPAMLFTSVTGWPLHVSGRDGLWWRMLACRVWTCLCSKKPMHWTLKGGKESNQKQRQKHGQDKTQTWLNFFLMHFPSTCEVFQSSLFYILTYLLQLPLSSHYELHLFL